MKKRIAVIPGDGIGLDVTPEALKVLRAIAETGGHEFIFTEFDWGAERYLATGVSLPEDALDDLRRNYDVVFLGALGDPRVPAMKHATDILFGLRFGLELYANIRPVKLLAPQLTPLRDRSVGDLDFVVVRENTEGLYSGLEHTIIPGVVESLKVVTEHASLRIARYAFAYARRHHFDQVCTVHKANILKLSDGLFLDCSRRIAKEFPEIKYAELIVDNACMQLVLNPERY